jgi:hypothetical protein
MADPWAGGLEPAGRVRFKEMLPTLVFDVNVSILVFNLFTRYGVATLAARVTRVPQYYRTGSRPHLRPLRYREWRTV